MLIESASAAPRPLMSVSFLVGTGPSAAGCRGFSSDPSGIAPIAEERRPPGRAFWSLQPSPRPVLLGSLASLHSACHFLLALLHTCCQGAGVAVPEGETWRISLWRARRNGLIPGGSVVSGEVRRNRRRTSAPSWAFFRPQRPNSCPDGQAPSVMCRNPAGAFWHKLEGQS